MTDSKYVNLYSRDELLAFGFESVAEETFVSRDARLFAIQGKLAEGVRIDAFAILTGHIELGVGVHISPFCFLGGSGGRIKMQDHSGISTHVSIFTESDDYSHENREAGHKIGGDVTIQAYSILGAGCKVMPGTTIHEKCSIGCNCVINQDIPAGSNIINRGLSLINLGQRA